METLELEDPLPKKALQIGIVYNLKKGIKTEVIDEEAEYDSIDTVLAIKAALETQGHNVILLEADKSLPDKLRDTHIDIAFNIAEGFGGRCRELRFRLFLTFMGYHIPAPMKLHYV